MNILANRCTPWERESMALRDILVWPDPRLKQKGKPVPDVDAGVRKICDDMAETMYEANGVGLAAPQVGVLLNLIVMDVEQRAAEGEELKKKGEGLFWLINPVLKVGEGEFTYTDRDGKRKQKEATNTLLSVCVQHEMDHLQGKLFVDHLSALKRELIRRRMKKLKSQREAEKKGEATAL